MSVQTPKSRLALKPTTHDRELGQTDPSATADRRRKQSRILTEIIPARLHALPAADAELLRAIFDRGIPVARLSTISAADHRHAAKLRYRVRRLVARVLSPGFVFVLRHQSQIPDALQGVARACVLQGRTQRDASIELALPLFEVRRRLIAVRALIDAATK